MSRVIETSSVKETHKLAHEIAKNLKAGDVIGLAGNLGSGKTTFVQGLARALNVPSSCYVNSPTFTLLNEYLGGDLPVYHFDFYRLNSSDEFIDLGFYEYFNGNGISLVEWAEKFIDELPERAYRLEFSVVDETTREIKVPEELWKNIK
ncbi:tRNA (adenosine(37)-N6)-threonylcarbamoyltransferase complex ATPase subunit type 1 TsaE [bacterium]|nr:tRNA (adenosine(37)-N6)-threonylcarbamoyltransferase complex ATPase subunit type 1 TsaE [bacterium]